MSQVSGDICLDFRENSKDEILKIKEFFNEKKSLSQHSNQAWLRNGELKDDVFVCGQYLSFSSVDVKKGTIENVSEFLKELIHVVPDISFKGKVFEEYETMDRKLRIKKRREDADIRFEVLEFSKLRKDNLDDIARMMRLDGYSREEIIAQLDVVPSFIEDALK